MEVVRIEQLFSENQEELHLTWVAGKAGGIRELSLGPISPADIVGHLNFIHPNRIQVIGSDEVVHAQGLSADRRRSKLMQLFQGNPPAVIIADNAPVMEFVIEEAERAGTAVWTTPLAAAKVIDLMRAYFYRRFAEITYLHGVFMDVLGLGVLLMGDSGLGKSELALELISRGHGLVADDSVEISCIAPNVLMGRAPDLIKNYLEVRGLGLLDIQRIFGETAVRPKMKVKLVVHLYKSGSTDPGQSRLPSMSDTLDILGVPVRRINLPVAVGRNLAVLVEAAVRKFILELRSIDCTAEFIFRQQQAILATEREIQQSKGIVAGAQKTV